MIYIRKSLFILSVLVLFLSISCSQSKLIDNAIKKQEIAEYYYAQKDYIEAKKYCKEALGSWETLKHSKVKLFPSWAIEHNYNRSKKFFEIIPTPEVLKTPTSVPIKVIDSAFYVNATLNLKENVTLLLDTGASITIITPHVAELLGISPKENAPKSTGTVIGGKTIEMLFVRLSKIEVGDAGVDNLLVGVHSVFPNKLFVDGVLGADFLKNFKVTVDHNNKTLRLVSPKEIL